MSAEVAHRPRRHLWGGCRLPLYRKGLGKAIARGWQEVIDERQCHDEEVDFFAGFVPPCGAEGP